MGSASYSSSDAFTAASVSGSGLITLTMKNHDATSSTTAMGMATSAQSRNDTVNPKEASVMPTTMMLRPQPHSSAAPPAQAAMGEAIMSALPSFDLRGLPSSTSPTPLPLASSSFRMMGMDMATAAVLVTTDDNTATAIMMPRIILLELVPAHLMTTPMTRVGMVVFESATVKANVQMRKYVLAFTLLDHESLNDHTPSTGSRASRARPVMVSGMASVIHRMTPATMTASDRQPSCESPTDSLGRK